MSEPFLGEIRAFGFDFPSAGWARCDGQLLPISQNTALFSILGTTYGGDGETTFALPDLRGRVPVHASTDGTAPLGARAGEEEHTLTVAEMPAHSHTVTASTGAADQPSPANARHAAATSAAGPVYADATPDTTFDLVATSGGGQPHHNMQPYLAVNYCIAVVGVFPSES